MPFVGGGLKPSLQVAAQVFGNFHYTGKRNISGRKQRQFSRRFRLITKAL
jgi:hypothetical protein